MLPCGSAASRVLIIGGGLAGACTAEAIVRHCELTAEARQLVGSDEVPLLQVVDQGARIAAGASGNPFGIILPNLTADSGDFYPSGFDYSLRWLQESQHHDLFEITGGLQLPSTQKLRRMMNTRGLDLATPGRVASAEEASEYAQIKCPAGIIVEQAGVYRPAELVRRLIGESGAQVDTAASVVKLQRSEEPGWPGWEARVSDGRRYFARDVVVCAAFSSARFFQLERLPCEAVRGQTGQLSSTPASRGLKRVISYGSYLTPVVDNDIHFVGSTFSHQDFLGEPRDSDSEKILSTARKWLPSLNLEGPLLAPRVCFRTSTIDRLPYIGQLDEGLYVNCGHGSKGILSCPIAGEIIARSILGKSTEEFSSVLEFVHPSRVLN